MTSVISRFRLLLRSLGLLVLGAAATTSQATLPTDWFTPTPAEVRVRQVGFDGRMAVALSSLGFRASFDGELWTPPDGGPVVGDYFILQAGGPFHALPANGNGRTAYVSTDGVTWNSNALTGTRPWAGVAYTGGRFAAAGTGTLDTSEDGVTWTARPAPHRRACTGLAQVRDRFVLLSDTEGVWDSPDGLTWRPHALFPQPTNTPPQEIVHWGALNCLNGRCFAFGRKNSTLHIMVAISDNGGADWDVQPFGGETFVTGMAYGQGRYVVAGSGVLGYSDDGRHWTFDESTLSSLNPTAVAFVNGRFVGYDGEGYAYVSDDGIRWRQRTLPHASLNAVAATPNGFVAVGQRGTILTSPNGFDWRVETNANKMDLYAVANAGGLTIATGANGTILTSPDDRVWTRSAYVASVHTNSLHGVAYARGRYVIAGGYLTSTNGTTWEVTPGYASSPTNYMQSVIDDGTQFVAFGPATPPETGNVIGRSADGLTWTYANTGLNRPDYGRSLSHGDGVYVGVGTGFLSASTNATDWQLIPRFDQLQAVIHTVDGFVAVGNPQDSTSQGLVLLSPDGTNWTPVALNGTGSLNGVAYRDGVYVAVTARGGFFCSTPAHGVRLAQHRWLPGRGFQFGLGGVPNRQYRVQYTTDLQTWTDLRTVTAPSSFDVIPVLDPDAASGPGRAYRVVSP